MITFRFLGKTYAGETALDVVYALQRDAKDYPYPGRSIRTFLKWSLENSCDRIPPRDLGLSNRLGDDELALSYLYLRDEYGSGQLSISRSKVQGREI